MGYTTTQANEFIQLIAPLMLMEGRARGYNIISTAIAQAIIEGAANTSILAKTYHNHWGLKCGNAWLKAGKPSVNLKTKEEYSVGTLTTINDYFRVYANDLEGVKGYYDFISTSRYANLKTATNYLEYANMLKLDGYATSSSYVNTLSSTVRKYNLDRYDISSASGYVIGRTYTTQSDLYIRYAPDGDKMELKSLTSNAQMNAYTDKDGYSILRKGTRVTCKGIKELETSTWISIPSGWICAKNSSKTFVK